MNCARILLVLFAAAALFANLAVVDQAEHQTFPQPAAVAAMGLAFGQISLSAVWLVYARWNITLRMLLMLAVVLYWSGPIAGVTGQAAAPWLSLFLGHAAMVAAAALAAKAWGVRLVLVERSCQIPGCTVIDVFGDRIVNRTYANRPDLEDIHLSKLHELVSQMGRLRHDPLAPLQTEKEWLGLLARKELMDGWTKADRERILSHKHHLVDTQQSDGSFD